MTPGSSGSSPCTLTMRSHGRLAAISSETIGAGTMRRSGHHRDAAKALDGAGNPLIVCGDDHAGDGPRLGGASIDVFDHRPAGEIRESFSWKARRVVARGDDGRTDVSASAKGKRVTGTAGTGDSTTAIASIWIGLPMRASGDYADYTD